MQQRCIIPFILLRPNLAYSNASLLISSDITTFRVLDSRLSMRLVRVRAAVALEAELEVS